MVVGVVWLWHFLVNLDISSSPFHLATAQSQCLMATGMDSGSTTLCHSWGFACQQRLLKTFPGPGHLHSKDRVALCSLLSLSLLSLSLCSLSLSLLSLSLSLLSLSFSLSLSSLCLCSLFLSFSLLSIPLSLFPNADNRIKKNTRFCEKNNSLSPQLFQLIRIGGKFET